MFVRHSTLSLGRVSWSGLTGADQQQQPEITVSYLSLHYHAVVDKLSLQLIQFAYIVNGTNYVLHTSLFSGRYNQSTKKSIHIIFHTIKLYTKFILTQLSDLQRIFVSQYYTSNTVISIHTENWWGSLELYCTWHKNFEILGGLKLLTQRAEHRKKLGQRVAKAFWYSYIYVKHM